VSDDHSPNLKKSHLAGNHWPSEKTIALVGIILIVLLAGWLRLGNLESIGYGNHYYTATVESMLKSWHNFFFVSAEPGGAVSVDKPPVGFWIQAVFAWFLGVNGLAVVLPEIIAGLASVVLVFHLVRRTFGTAAGLLAGLALAITPVVGATDRNNTIDSLLILTLLLAAWAWIKARGTSRMRFLLLGAALVGIGFNIKMLQAFLPLPAFFGLYLLGAREKFGRKIFKLFLAGLLLLVISLSWVTIVDLVPASERPYVGSSSDNSEWTLAIGYNGLSRLFGMGRNGGGAVTRPAANAIPNPVRPNRQAPAAGDNPTQFNPPVGPGNAPPAGLNRPGGAGMNTLGQPGILRLITGSLSKETSWLLPPALFGLLALVLGKFSWPLNARCQAAILWGGWLLTAGIFFSVASFFHEYYLAMLGAPMAALAGIGMIELWQWLQKKGWLGMAALAILAGMTLALQFIIAGNYLSVISWQPWVWALAALGIIAAFLAALLKNSTLLKIGFCLLLAAMLVTPLVWSVFTMQYSSVNQSLPAAFNGSMRGLENRGGLQINQPLLNYLQVNTQGIEYLMAVPSSMQGADYVLATGRPVLYMGGFNGSDAVVSAADLQFLVDNDRLRYIYLSPAAGNAQSQNEIYRWVVNSCKNVSGFETQTANMGNPDGTGGAPGGMGPSGGPGMVGRGFTQIALYDCAR
jgi:4-amino-4-deoxy-L-arabinose transferase-like glycosyltransferase